MDSTTLWEDNIMKAVTFNLPEGSHKYTKKSEMQFLLRGASIESPWTQLGAGMNHTTSEASGAWHQKLLAEELSPAKNILQSL